MCQHSVVILVCKSSFRETAVSCCIEYFKFKSLFFFKSLLSKCVCCVQLCLVWLHLFCIWALQCYICIFFSCWKLLLLQCIFLFYWPPTWHENLAFVLMLETVVNELLAWLSPVLVLFLLKIDSDSCKPTMCFCFWIIPPSSGAIIIITFSFTHGSF